MEACYKNFVRLLISIYKMYRRRNGHHGPISIPHLRENVGFGELHVSVRKKVTPPLRGQTSSTPGCTACRMESPHSPWPAAWRIVPTAAQLGAQELSCNLGFFSVEQLWMHVKDKDSAWKHPLNHWTQCARCSNVWEAAEPEPSGGHTSIYVVHRSMDPDTYSNKTRRGLYRLLGWGFVCLFVFIVSMLPSKKCFGFVFRVPFKNKTQWAQHTEQGLWELKSGCVSWFYSLLGGWFWVTNWILWATVSSLMKKWRL